MIIKKVEIKNTNIKVILDNGDDFTILLETYLNNNLLIGDEIDEQKLDSLKKEDKISEARMKLVNMITKKRLSKNECIYYLKELDIEDSKIIKIVDSLEKNFLINDVELAQDLINYCLFNRKGIKVIKSKLNERMMQLDIEEIRRYLDFDKYKENVKSQLDKYVRLASNKSNMELKKYLKVKMTENGFMDEDFVEFIKDYGVDETKAIFNQVNKFFKNHTISRENVAKITKKLLSKGFDYAIIKEIIRECEENETY